MLHAESRPLTVQDARMSAPTFWTIRLDLSIDYYFGPVLFRTSLMILLIVLGRFRVVVDQSGFIVLNDPEVEYD